MVQLQSYRLLQIRINTTKRTQLMNVYDPIPVVSASDALTLTFSNLNAL